MDQGFGGSGSGYGGGIGGRDYGGRSGGTGQPVEREERQDEVQQPAGTAREGVADEPSGEGSSLPEEPSQPADGESGG